MAVSEQNPLPNAEFAADSQQFEPSYRKTPGDKSAEQAQPRRTNAKNKAAGANRSSKSSNDKKFLLVDSSNREVGPFTISEIIRMFPLGRQLPLHVKVEAIDTGASMSLDKFLSTRDTTDSRRDKTVLNEKIATSFTVPPLLALAVLLLAILVPVGYFYLRN